MTHPFAAMNLTTLDGEPLRADAYEGKVLLVVNVASRCGSTPQYEGLEALYKELRGRGFTVIGVPCNQFGKQEPGTPQEIHDFCMTTYGVDFPLLEKQDVNGDGRTALYKHLVDSDAGGGKDIGWNFEKFVVDKDGTVRGRFATKTEPDDPKVKDAITALLD